MTTSPSNETAIFSKVEGRQTPQVYAAEAGFTIDADLSRPARNQILHRKMIDTTRPTALDTKAIAEDGTFEGYASLFGCEDLSRDVVLRGAFRDSLRQRGARAIKMLFQHDPATPIGVWDEVREDERGLYVRGRLMTAVARAREVLELMRAGALDGLSIGFKAVQATRDARSGVRRIAKVDLWEISIVTFPMLPAARVETVKARPLTGGAPTMRDFERWLTRDAGLTRMEARAISSAGFEGLKALREARLAEDNTSALADRLWRAARQIKQAMPSRM